MISITPFLPSEKVPGRLKDKSVEIYKRSAKLQGSIRPGLNDALTYLLRFVNSYYSNKIEGNKTRPADILKEQHTDELNEIIAHVSVQEELANERPSFEEVSSSEFLLHIHELLFQNISVVKPGEFRELGVRVGRHDPPEAKEIAAYMSWFHDSFRLDRIHGDMRLLAAAASHHRLLWIHPFMDGNGRVTRLFTDIYMQLAGVDGYGLWSISRGFSRAVDQYKAKLEFADTPRQGSTDGRGILSDRGLVGFQEFFLDTCLEQLEYVSGLLDIEGFEKRLNYYVGTRVNEASIDPAGKPLPKWRPETAKLLLAVISNSEVLRSDAPEITGLGETVSRKIVKQLVDEGWLKGEEKKPLKLQIPFEGISPLFPHLW